MRELSPSTLMPSHVMTKKCKTDTHVQNLKLVFIENNKSILPLMTDHVLLFYRALKAY